VQPRGDLWWINGNSYYCNISNRVERISCSLMLPKPVRRLRLSHPDRPSPGLRRYNLFI
jgi:hypothetical protein